MDMTMNMTIKTLHGNQFFFSFSFLFFFLYRRSEDFCVYVCVTTSPGWGSDGNGIGMKSSPSAERASGLRDTIGD